MVFFDAANHFVKTSKHSIADMELQNTFFSKKFEVTFSSGDCVVDRGKEANNPRS